MKNNEFNQLPIEMSSNILKYNPYMQQLNKTYQQSTKHLFYEQYCDTPISQKEFVNYVNIFKPKQFSMFVLDENFKILLFTYNEELDKYIVDYYLFTIDLSDVEEYKMTYEYTYYHYNSFNHYIKLFSHNYKHQVFYDIQLSIDI